MPAVAADMAVALNTVHLMQDAMVLEGQELSWQLMVKTLSHATYCVCMRASNAHSPAGLMSL